MFLCYYIEKLKDLKEIYQIVMLYNFLIKLFNRNQILI